VMPLSPLYKPLVLSEERYREVSIPDGHITVNVQAKDFDSTRGRDPYTLDAWESQFYTAKIDLHPNGFAYPITSIRIDIMKGTTKFADGLLIDEDCYEVYGGSIYFTRTFESIIGDSFEGWEEVLEQDYAEQLIGQTIYYTLHITFEQAVPDTTGQTSRWALTQAVHYTIMDYFNQYEFAQTSANMIGEIGYTECLTFYSTLLSLPFAALGSYAVHGLFGTQAIFGAATVRALLGQIAVGMVTAPFKEIFEEVVYDALLESFVENAVDNLGGTEDMGFWLSSLATSVRESSGSLAKIALGQIKSKGAGIKNAFKLMKSLRSGDPKVALNGMVEFNDGLDQRQQQDIDKKASQKAWKKYLRTDLLKGIALIASSLLTGGLSFFTVLGMSNTLEAAVEMRMEPTVQQLTAQNMMRKGIVTDLKECRDYLTGDYYLSMEGESGAMLGLRQPKTLEEFGAELFGDMETIGTVPTFQTRQTGASPDQALHMIQLHVKKGSGEDRNFYEIKKDICQQMALNPALSYNLFIHGKMIQSIHELLEVISQDVTITVMAQQEGAARFIDKLRDERGKHQDELSRVLQAINDMKGKTTAERKTMFENIFGFNDADTDKTELMKKFLVDPNYKLFGYKYIPSAAYRNWLEKRIDVLDERINIGNNNRKFASRARIRQNLERYGEFAEMVDGDKYEILLPEKRSSLTDFLKQNNLEKFAEEFAIFVNGRQANDFSRTVDRDDEIMIIPTVGNNNQLSPLFIDTVINPILSKIETNSRDLSKVPANQLDLVRLWWATAVKTPYSEEDHDPSKPSKFTPHLELFQYDLIQFAYKHRIIEKQTKTALDSLLLASLKEAVKRVRNNVLFIPGKNIFSNIYAKIKLELEGNDAAIAELDSMFHTFVKFIGYGEHVKTYQLRIMVQDWIIRLYKMGILSKSTISSLDNLFEGKPFQTSLEKTPRFETVQRNVEDLKDELKGILDEDDNIFDIIDKDFKTFSLLYKESIYDLIEEKFGSQITGKRIFLENIAQKVSEVLNDNIGNELLNYFVFSDFLFQDNVVLKYDFLRKGFLRSFVFHSSIFAIKATIKFREFNTFIELFPETIRDGITSSVDEGLYSRLQDGVLETIDDWCAANHFEIPHIALKDDIHLERYGKDIAQKEYNLVYDIYELFYRVKGIRSFKDIGRECKISKKRINSLTSALTSANPSALLVPELLRKIAKTINGYIKDFYGYIEGYHIDYGYIEGIHKDYLQNVVDNINQYIEMREEVALEYFNVWTPYVLSSNYKQYCKGFNKLTKFLDKERANNVLNIMKYLARKYSDRTEALSVLNGLTDKGDFQFKGKEKKLIKTLWIESLLADERIEFNEYKFDDKDTHTDISELSKTLIARSQAILEQKGPKFFKEHKNLDVLVHSLDECLSSENLLAIHFKNSKRYWTGRPDLILKEGNTIVIADYKPNYDLGGNPNKHFINGIAQLIGYALIMQSQIDTGLEIKCVMFNEKGEAIEFDPYDMLPQIELFLNGRFDGGTHNLKGEELKDYNDALREYRGIKPKTEFANFFEDFKDLRILNLLDIYYFKYLLF